MGRITSVIVTQASRLGVGLEPSFSLREFPDAASDTYLCTMKRAIPTILTVVFVLGALAVLRQPDAMLKWLEELRFGSSTSATSGEAATPSESTSQFANVRPDGSPVTFSPCSKWTVSINSDYGPPGAKDIVNDAVKEIRKATGLKLSVGQDVDEPTALDRSVYQLDRYGDTWAPILVGWANDGLSSDETGGGPGMVENSAGKDTYVSGLVALNAEGSFNDSPAQLKSALLRGLGHVVGLAYSQDSNSLMYWDGSGSMEFSQDEMAALKSLGEGECVSTLGSGGDKGLAG
ncbi:MAG: hypothetical protein CMH41_04125 [Micrococcales bacterium]|nr:hypothetical protein [Micrococcales bacterium]